jgi:hypothetical protein
MRSQGFVGQVAGHRSAGCAVAPAVFIPAEASHAFTWAMEHE